MMHPRNCGIRLNLLHSPKESTQIDWMMCVFNAFPGRECGYTAFLLERPAFSSSQHVTAEFTQASTSGFMFRKCNGLSQADFLGVFIVLISRKKNKNHIFGPPWKYGQTPKTPSCFGSGCAIAASKGVFSRSLEAVDGESSSQWCCRDTPGLDEGAGTASQRCWQGCWPHKMDGRVEGQPGKELGAETPHVKLIN